MLNYATTRVQLGSPSAVCFDELYTPLGSENAQVHSINDKSKRKRPWTVLVKEPVKCTQLEEPRKCLDNLKMTMDSTWKKHHSKEELCGHPTLLCSCSGFFSKYEPRKWLWELFLTWNGKYVPDNLQGCFMLIIAAQEFQISWNLPETSRC